MWTTYVSKRYGLSIAHPVDWTPTPPDHDWTLPKDALWPNTATERFYSEGEVDGQGVAVSVWSVAVDPGTSVDSWLQTYCQKNNVDCTGILDQAVAATMDGHPGSLVTFDDVPHAIFLVDGRIYVIACWRPTSTERAEVLRVQAACEAFVSTIHLLPGAGHNTGNFATILNHSTIRAGAVVVVDLGPPGHQHLRASRRRTRTT